MRVTLDLAADERHATRALKWILRQLLRTWGIRVTAARVDEQ
jgi:hypothetical protein